jgi:hypothetical protein
MNQPNIVIAFKTNPDLATARLTELRREYGNTVVRMCDIYGIGLLMANYEVRIGKHDTLGPLDLEQLLTLLATADYFEESGDPIKPNSTIGIHHQNTGKHIFVHVRKDGEVFVLYHTNHRDAEEEEFVIQAIRPARDVAMVRVGFYEKLYRLSATEQEDLGTLIDALQLGKQERADYQLEIPAQHPDTPVREVIGAKILKDFDRNQNRPHDMQLATKPLDPAPVELSEARKQMQELAAKAFPFVQPDE